MLVVSHKYFFEAICRIYRSRTSGLPSPSSHSPLHQDRSFHHGQALSSCLARCQAKTSNWETQNRIHENLHTDVDHKKCFLNNKPCIQLCVVHPKPFTLFLWVCQSDPEQLLRFVIFFPNSWLQESLKRRRWFICDDVIKYENIDLQQCFIPAPLCCLSQPGLLSLICIVFYSESRLK